MARYIDADIALDKMKNWHTQERLMDCVRDTPTADVVEVVRCKDCKHSREQDRVFGITDYKCSKHNISCLSPYDFCSYGEGTIHNG